jgi:uncharacterized membrane protein
MAFCGKCGGEVAAGAAFCAKCGSAQPVGAAAGGAAVAQSGQAAQSGMSENVAGLLCYVLGWVTGLIFFLIDKRPFVRFHAAQSIVVFGGLHILQIALGMLGAGMFFMHGFGLFGMGWALSGLLGLVGLILWILLMVKAYQHEKFEVPIAAGIAKGFAGN